jgi:hypothetical protein
LGIVLTGLAVGIAVAVSITLVLSWASGLDA